MKNDILKPLSKAVLYFVGMIGIIVIVAYLANNIIVSGGLGSGGGYNSNYNERAAENKYGYENNTDKQKSVKNNFLENAKKKGN